MEKEIICTVCPRGCTVLVTKNGDGEPVATGFGCERGHSYAIAEFTNPVRILTTTVLTDGEPLPVRSSAPVPKKDLIACMEEIRKLHVTGPVEMHEVLIKDILGLGVDIVATKSIR